MSRVAEICKIDEKTLTQVQFVSKTKYYFGKGYVELCLNEHIRPYVLEMKERFTEIELGYAIRLSSFYAIRIYELLKCGQYRQGVSICPSRSCALSWGSKRGSWSGSIISKPR
jgi:plasmid replication initiation protein